ncbi:MAG: hypothetical protein HRF45_03140 [Fimbriimonadia bacterium]|jgi:flagellar basal-body rod modification protein FlgD
MTINGVSTATGVGSLGGQKKELDQEAFLQILVTQLSGQNPFEPVSDKELFQQLATLTSVQGINELRHTMALTRAQGMLGHQIDFYDSYGEQRSGVVSKIVFSGSGVMLDVDGLLVSPDRVIQDYGPPK